MLGCFKFPIPGATTNKFVSTGIAAADICTGFGASRIAVRLGGSRASPAAAVAFWSAAITTAGLICTVLTNALQLKAYWLKGNCPECSCMNRVVLNGSIFRIDDQDSFAVVRFSFSRTVAVNACGQDPQHCPYA